LSVQLPKTTIPIYDPSDQTTLDCTAFDRLQIVTQPRGGTLISWGLKPGFTAKEPFHFYVDFGRAGTVDGDWETLNCDPIVDECTFLDPEQRYFDTLADFYYRVRLVLPNEDCKVYASQPHQANGLWSKRDWLTAREIVRKEYLQQNKRTNITAQGQILKRRKFGEKCTRCSTWDTGEVEASRCLECYGTGILRGYRPAVDYRVTMDAPWDRVRKFNDKAGTQYNIVRAGRGVAYPHIETRDVFVRRDNGERYVVQNVKTLVEVGGIPLIYMLELRLAPVTDMIYEIPLSGGGGNGSGESDSSSSSPAPCNYAAGLNEEFAW